MTRIECWLINVFINAIILQLWCIRPVYDDKIICKFFKKKNANLINLKEISDSLYIACSPVL